MIMMRLMGGLGNQMFQYATGRALAQTHRTTLKLDTSFFSLREKDLTPRRYELSHFRIVSEIATEDDLARVRPAPPKGWKKVRERFRPQQRRRLTHIREPSPRFDPRVPALPDNVYLEGYWQCEKYFLSIAGLLREEFSLEQPPGGKNETFLREIQATDSVALHVRRGDYASNRTVHEVHGLCSLDYYRRAVEMISGRVKHPTFFVFSDDPDWTRDNLRLEFPAHFMTHNSVDHGFEDLRLMAHCRHFILANSSFSWWGSWLASHPRKIVAAPRRWFSDPGIDSRDIYFHGTTRIDA